MKSPLILVICGFLGRCRHANRSPDALVFLEIKNRRGKGGEKMSPLLGKISNMVAKIAVLREHVLIESKSIKTGNDKTDFSDCRGLIAR